MCEIGGFGGWNGGMFYVTLNREEIAGSLRKFISGILNRRLHVVGQNCHKFINFISGADNKRTTQMIKKLKSCISF